MRINQNPNSNLSDPNFTSVVQARVFVDGRRSIRTSNMRRGLRGVQHILTNPANGDPQLIAIKSNILTHLKDYHYYGEKVHNIGEYIRNVVHEKEAAGYLFTGPQVTKLNELGKIIGPEKHAGLEVIGSTDTYESSLAVKKYFKQTTDFINNDKIRVKESLNPDTGLYQGDEMILNIYTKSQGEPGKKGFKLDIDSVSWETARPQVKPEVKPESKPESKGLTLIKKLKKVKQLADYGQTRLLF